MIAAVARWKPDARGRLAAAAMELYRERGFDRTTVAEIAARAGLTERTFFRYFSDKREVLFWGSGLLEQFLVDKVIAAPPAMAPIDAVAGALEATAPQFEERRDFARRRQNLIAGHAELRERELIKLASLASAIRDALRARGVPDQTASLAAEAGIAIFKSAFARWLDDPRKRDIAHHVRESLGELRTVASGATSRRPPTPVGKSRGVPGATRTSHRRR
jgi:AcrR family transcriptional regulator